VAELTINGSGSGRYLEELRTAGTTTFQNPLVSFAYERGWRSSFAWAGFPGEEAEFIQASNWLEKADNGELLDLSCGSGLFTRRFANSSRYSSVLGLDLSAAMLQEARSLSRGTAPITWIRADVARLPIVSGSLAGIHAGAALHCWPSPSSALAEVARTLRPGGVFVASTFLDPTAPLAEVVGDDAVLPLSRLITANRSGRSVIRWWNEAELRDLCTMVGLVGFERIRTRQFILFRAFKPGRAAAEPAPPLDAPSSTEPAASGILPESEAGEDTAVVV